MENWATCYRFLASSLQDHRALGVNFIVTSCRLRLSMRYRRGYRELATR